MAQLAGVAAAGFSAYGASQKGKAAKRLKEQEARGLNEAALWVKAATSREMEEEARNRDFMYSRALAVAAFSGAGTGDQGVVTLLGDLSAEGEYRILSRLYRGEDEAEGLRYRAKIAREEGIAARSASRIAAVTSAISAYAATT